MKASLGILHTLDLRLSPTEHFIPPDCPGYRGPLRPSV